MTTVRRIAIVGAECVGKTELAQTLAEALPGLCIPEYLREFCYEMARTPQPNEQAIIVAQQIAREQAMLAAAAARGLTWVLADSAPIATALYSELLFADSSLTAGAIAHHRRYDATLLLAPDLPWQADGIQRDGPQVRGNFHELLLRTMQAARLPFRLVGGIGAVRSQSAAAALREL